MKYKNDAEFFRKKIDALGLSQLQAAKDIGSDPRTARRYALGECPLPHPIRVLLHMMGEAQKVKGRKK